MKGIRAREHARGRREEGTGFLSSLLALPRVSLAPETPFPIPFKRLPRRLLRLLLTAGEKIAQRANDFKVTNLQFLSEFCHFSYFNDKSQTKVRNSLMLISVCLSEFRVYK